MSRDRKPFFADGTIIGDYKLLFEYWNILRERGMNRELDKAFLSRRDFEYIRNLVYEKKRVNLQELLDELTDKFLPRIYGDAAREAFMKVYGVEVDEEYAKRRIAYLLAGWLIEAAKNTGIVKLTK